MVSDKEDLIQFRIPLEIIEEDGCYVCSYQPLNAHGQGRTAEEAVSSFKQALRAVVEICQENGNLSEVVAQLPNSAIEGFSLA